MVTANGWCVDTARLQATVRHFAPRVRFVDLTGVAVTPEAGRPFGFEAVAGLLELVGWRRLGWVLGVAASAAVLAVATANLGHQGLAPVGVIVGAVALVRFGWRVAVTRRRRRRSARPQNWLESGPADAEGSRLGMACSTRLCTFVLAIAISMSPSADELREDAEFLLRLNSLQEREN